MIQPEPGQLLTEPSAEPARGPERGSESSAAEVASATPPAPAEPAASDAAAAGAPRLPRRAPRLTVVARDPGRCEGAVLGWDGGWRALASASVPASPELGEDLGQLKQELSAALPAGEKLPRQAILLWSEVVSACVELPAGGRLTPERTETLLGWELEPFLAPEPVHEPSGEAQAEVACGWARAEGSGPLLACGVRPRARAAAREAFARAGLRLRGLYPRLGCAAAELPARVEPSVVLELGRGAVATSRLERGRVVTTRVARCAVGSEVDLASSLLPREAALEIAGPVPGELREALLGERWSELVGPGSGVVAAGLAGAARHALGLSGGARLAAVPPARARRLRLPAGLLKGLAGSVLVLGLVGGVEVQLERELRQARAALGEAERRAQAGQQVRGLRQRLAAQRKSQALEREVRERARGLPLLLRDLAAAIPPELELRSAKEVPGGLLLEGVSLDELAVSRFVGALAPRLRAHDLAAGLPSVSPAEGEPYYRFSLTFTRHPERP